MTTTRHLDMGGTAIRIKDKATAMVFGFCLGTVAVVLIFLPVLIIFGGRM